ncbi:exonuclease V a 5' deoxyribonuclease-domain-containing protein [Dendryphion nanum]|uniref:Exonuclease V a 5' deoxyribonuclease-domain-containing protein n=1 Tax=Dendryphion nanum TaxID=256645 RepID=A0A9P9D9B3_9PLEO|nr:exonuclease V a 5' deoxyribonuclease-domain-containing protein [Dendryphion nanum]
MANPVIPSLTAEGLASEYGSDLDFGVPALSDYGSDFDNEEEALLRDLLAQIATNERRNAPQSTETHSVEGDNDAEQSTIVHVSPLPAVARVANSTAGIELFPNRRTQPIEVEYDGYSRDSWSVPRSHPTRQEQRTNPSMPTELIENDTQSPLQRFRTKPKKPLSVTDLVSPAWCELQYWYNLNKFGRKPQTPAMKQGSKVHKVLEEQVHKIVPILVESKEDRFGLRIWNTIQGLRTLRETGMTRELEIWGIVDGEVVNGVIDEVSYTCPDSGYGEALEQSKAPKIGGTRSPGQSSILQSFANDDIGVGGWVSADTSTRTTYIADVKTRGVKAVPVGASLKPTWMQLMVYRKLLKGLALNTVDAETVFARYGVLPLEPFTEQFICGASGIEQMTELEPDEEDPPDFRRASEISIHNNLSALWSLMISEFALSMKLFSDILRAEFRYAKTGEIIGNKMLVYSDKQIDEYLASEMKWWKGLREAKGVEIEDAYKCRVCPFADECTWRRMKIQEATEKYRLKAAARPKSAV